MCLLSKINRINFYKVLILLKNPSIMWIGLFLENISPFSQQKQVQLVCETLISCPCVLYWGLNVHNADIDCLGSCSWAQCHWVPRWQALQGFVETLWSVICGRWHVWCVRFGVALHFSFSFPFTGKSKPVVSICLLQSASTHSEKKSIQTRSFMHLLQGR